MAAGAPGRHRQREGEKDAAIAFVAATAVALAFTLLGANWLGLSFAPLGLLGTALSIFLAFRANTSFARWGEAAQSWAAITDSHRHTPQYNPDAADGFKRELVYRQIAWAHTLRLQLRGQHAWAVLTPLLPSDDVAALPRQPNKPLFLMQRQGERIYEAMAAGILQGFDSFQLEGQLAMLSA